MSDRFAMDNTWALPLVALNTRHLEDGGMVLESLEAGCEAGIAKSSSE